MSRLLTEELRNILPKLREQEGSANPTVFAKFFFPSSRWTWFVTEGEAEETDFLFYGYVIGFESEWGYFSLTELEGVDIHGQTIVATSDFSRARLSECLKILHRDSG